MSPPALAATKDIHCARALTQRRGTLSAPDGAYGGRATSMCLDCGCGEPNERHEDDRHITMDDLKAAAAASETSVEEAARNISDGLRQAQPSSGTADSA